MKFISGIMRVIFRSLKNSKEHNVWMRTMRILNIISHTTMTMTSKLFMFIFVLSHCRHNVHSSLSLLYHNNNPALVESLKVLRSRMFSYSVLTFIWLHLKSIESWGIIVGKRIEQREVSNYERAQLGWFIRLFSEIIISFCALVALHKRVERVQ